MKRHPLTRRRLALNFIGVLALLLHLASTASMAGMGIDGQVICTAQGLVSISSLAPDEPAGELAHECCELGCVCATVPCDGCDAVFDFAADAASVLALVAAGAEARAPPSEYSPSEPRGPPPLS
ncbi:MAG: hypothetical protein KDH17_04340 [Rhodocyclaceae bacterium]|nr:hypothetical protein [Rhodocyclaceae bacterium]